MHRRLTSTARCAIKMRSQESDVAKALKKLERDLINGPFHCFGQHEKCSSDFCETAKEKEQEPLRSSDDGNEYEQSNERKDLQSKCLQSTT